MKFKDHTFFFSHGWTYVSVVDCLNPSNLILILINRYLSLTGICSRKQPLYR